MEIVNREEFCWLFIFQYLVCVLISQIESLSAWARIIAHTDN